MEFVDLANFIIKVPLRFIYRKRNYYSVGYARFERDLFEALRIYKGIQELPEYIRHYLLDQLVADKVRVFGFENISIYLNYENMIRILLIALLGSQRFKKGSDPVCLNFLNLVDIIEKRYEALNNTLSNIRIDKLWNDENELNRLFKIKTGLLLTKDETKKVLTIDFVDSINISKKISHMATIDDVDHLKNYYHTSLHSLRKNPFYTDDYELQLEEAFEKRLVEITDLILNQAKKQIEILKDFREVHNVYTDLQDRALEIGFNEDQKHRLNDLYDLRKDNLRREKLEEINSLLETMHDINELKHYWDNIKWFLLNNRPYLGKEFETLIAKNFDTALKRLRDMSFQIHFLS